jgi:hypothetical protein
MSVELSVEWQGKPKYSEKPYRSATLSTTNPTWPDLGSNTARRGWKPASNRFSYGTAKQLPDLWVILHTYFMEWIIHIVYSGNTRYRVNHAEEGGIEYSEEYKQWETPTDVSE